MGGPLAAIEAGFQQRQIQESAYRYQREVESQARVVVGVNRFVDEATHAPPLQRIDPAAERAQVERLRQVRAERDGAAWSAALGDLAEAAAGTANLLPPIIAAVRVQATLGEISDTPAAGLGRASRADHGLGRAACPAGGPGATGTCGA